MMDVSTVIPEVFEGHALRQLFSGLDKNKIRYAVLRNHEQLPDRLGSRDIDLLLHPDDRTAARRVVVAMAKDLQLKLSDVFDDDMFSSIWMFGRGKNGAPFALSIDFFPGRRVYGVELYSVEDALSNLRFHRGIPVVRETYVFLDKWLYHLVVGKPTPAKYDELFADIAARHHRELVAHIEPFLGREEAEAALNVVSAGESSNLSPRSLRERLRMLCAPIDVSSFNSLFGPLRFLAYRLRDQFRLRGLFLSISGPDGSGKTTVIREVVAQLETIFGAGEINYAHFRPTVLPRIADVAKRAGAISTVDENYEQPHRAKPSGVVGSALRLIYYWFDYLGGYFTNILPVLKRREVMLFDRYYHDLIADSNRSRIALPKLLMRAFGRLLPMPDYAFFIRVDPNEIHRRKQELTLERIFELNEHYEDLVRRGWLIPIDNDGTPEEAAAVIVDYIVAARHAMAVRVLQ